MARGEAAPVGGFRLVRLVIHSSIWFGLAWPGAKITTELFFNTFKHDNCYFISVYTSFPFSLFYYYKPPGVAHDKLGSK